MAQFYRHSGIIPLRGLVQTLFAGAGTAISLGIAYSYASVYIPFVYVHVLLTGVLGTVLGVLVKGAARSGRIRNRFVPAAIGFISGLVALYFAWGGDILARRMLPPNAGILVAFKPLVLSSYIQWFYENGLWAMGKNGNGPLTGIPLAAVWIAEAAIIVGLATHFPWSEIRQWVFCEACGWWETIETNLHRFSAENADQIAERLNQEDLGVLRNMPLAKPDDQTFLRMHLATCETCDESNYLELEQVTLTVDKKGNVKTRLTKLVDKLLVAAADVPLVRAAGESSAAEASAEQTETATGAPQSLSDAGNPDAQLA
jgi:hypothetical protein